VKNKEGALGLQAVENLWCLFLVADLESALFLANKGFCGFSIRDQIARDKQSGYKGFR